MGGTSESNSNSNSSSGEEDGDVEWRKAIDSVAATTSSYVSSAISSAANHSSTAAADGADGRSHKPKHYQIKVGSFKSIPFSYIFFCLQFCFTR